MKILLCLFALLPGHASAGWLFSGVATKTNNRSYQIQLPGIEFRSCWSATIERDGQQQVVSSMGGVEADGPEKTIRFPDAGVDLLLRVERATEASAVFVQAGIRNTGRTSLHLTSVTPVETDFELGGDWSSWLVTGLHPRTPVVKALGEINEPVEIHEYGGLYQNDGDGFFFGPSGAPIAYLNFRVAPASGGKIAFCAVADMSGVLVDPGETRWGQQVALVFEQPQKAMDHWVGWVAQSHKARTGKGALTGWNNAHPLTKRDIRAELADVIMAVSESSARLRLGLIQVDDTGTKLGNRSVLDESWVSEYAKKVCALGARFGILLRFDGKEDRKTVTDTVRHAVQRGFTYLKIDRPKGGLAHEEKLTSFETYRAEFSAIRGAAGEEVYISYCGDIPDRAVVGLVDASRVGREARREDLRPAIEDLIRSFPLYGRWFVAEAGNVYLSDWKDNESRVQTVGGESEWQLTRLWMTLVMLSGANAITSDPLYRPEFGQYWKNIERMNPPTHEPLIVQGLCTQREWSLLTGEIKRDWGKWTLAMVWNPGNVERPFSVDLAKVGLKPQSKYAVWGIWDNRLLGVVQRSWSTHWMRKPDFELIRITEWSSGIARPTLIGSSLHFTAGNAEIKRIEASRSDMVIELTDAGVSFGDLFIRSDFPPILKKAVGCTVDGVSLVGENAWQIRIHDRDSKVPQRIELAFLLPLVQQPWLWVSVSAVVLSLLFSLWRYVVSLRLQRQQGLADERSRIAKDLHDDLGANLTQIAYHGDSLIDAGVLGPADTKHVERLRHIARFTTHALDEIVWAVDPKQDSLESFAGYLTGYAQEVLADAGLKCRFDFPPDFRGRPMSSKNRHHIFLAFKEALHNAIRHALATEVRIRLAVGEIETELEIRDDGRGFDTSQPGARPGGGHGLESMRERLKAVGGRCEITSHGDTGTRISFIWTTES